MPIFEYQCLECSREFEELVRGDEKDVRCPECGAARLKKLMSATRGENLENVLSKAPGDNFRKRTGNDPKDIF